jgi:DNA polymerase III delta prime subunit
MTEPKQLLSELLRPQQLGDLTLPPRIITRFQRMIESGSILNMLFYGGPGLGKTSAARVFINAVGPSDFIEVNGSDATGVDFVRERIVRFSSSLAMNGGTKICFIDEADYVSQNAQAALRKVIEEYSDNCRYLLAVNNISKLIPAIRSRLMEICFDIAPVDRVEVKKRLVERYERKLSDAGILIDKGRLAQIVSIYYPDLRSIPNHLEFEFVFA